MDRLTETNRQLLHANQELTTANTELRSANEEMLVANEEVQAATEEVETLNEELQATNEELETLNEELQATVEELNTTNDDLEARSVELQDLAFTLDAQRREGETERARLKGILSGLREAVLLVDGDGASLLTNPAYESAFGAAGAQLPAVDEEGRPLPPDQLPAVRVARGESFEMRFSVQGKGGLRRRFEAMGRPVSLDGDAPAGVLVIRELTEGD
jgi:two-component system CheB/CheR fusion protein